MAITRLHYLSHRMFINLFICEDNEAIRIIMRHNTCHWVEVTYEAFINLVLKMIADEQSVKRETYIPNHVVVKDWSLNKHKQTNTLSKPWNPNKISSFLFNKILLTSFANANTCGFDLMAHGLWCD